MLDKFLKEAVVIAVGKQAEDIASLLHSKKHVNEFIIAKKMNITINQTRHILYRLSDFGLVFSLRKKDKRKGWYTYFWKFDVIKCLEFLKKILIKKIEQVKAQIKSRETKQFYFCERCGIELNEETALLHDFTCNECGDIFSIKDNEGVLKEFGKRVNSLNKELELIEKAIDEEKKRLEKEKLKQLKKESYLKIHSKKKRVAKKIQKKVMKKVQKKKQKKKKEKKKGMKFQRKKFKKPKKRRKSSKTKR